MKLEKLQMLKKRKRLLQKKITEKKLFLDALQKIASKKRVDLWHSYENQYIRCWIWPTIKKKLILFLSLLLIPSTTIILLSWIFGNNILWPLGGVIFVLSLFIFLSSFSISAFNNFESECEQAENSERISKSKAQMKRLEYTKLQIQKKIQSLQKQKVCQATQKRRKK